MKSNYIMSFFGVYIIFCACVIEGSTAAIASPHHHLIAILLSLFGGLFTILPLTAIKPHYYPTNK